MKAQFFILGAVLLCSLFFIGLPPGQPLAGVSTQDMDYMMLNLEREFPRALNLGMDGGDPAGTMANFTSWVRTVGRGLLLNFSSFWLFAEGDPGGDVTVYLGNFMGTDMSVTLNLDGEQRSVLVGDGDLASETFASVGSPYNIVLLFGSEARNFDWQRDKVNLFVMLELERGENIARRDVVA
jgi:hypothetical protein